MSEASSVVRDASPKRSKGQGSEWYPYYAGFSASFVDQSLRSLSLPAGARVLDPWNGSGTTTARATLAGYSSVGIDINPAMALIAAGRLASRRDTLLLRSLAEADSASPAVEENDPLLFWLGPLTASAFRAMAGRIIEKHDTHLSAGLPNSAAAAAAYYAALGLVLRKLLRPQVGTNPAWHKQKRDARRRIALGKQGLSSLMEAAIASLEANLSDQSLASNTVLLTGDSRALNIEPGTIEAVITSPPYCTRLDYPIALQPELSLLGHGPDSPNFRVLREATQGTPMIRLTVPEPSTAWGRTSTALLAAIGDHSSRASKSYYHKTYAQYFDDLSRSFDEITRVCHSGSTCIIVVQSSWYKDIYVDLPSIVIDMLGVRRWALVDRIDFAVRHTLADTNSVSRAYRSGRGAAESAITMRFLGAEH